MGCLSEQGLSSLVHPKKEASLGVLLMFASTTTIRYSFLLPHTLTSVLSTSLSRILSDPSPLPRTRGLFTSRATIPPAQLRHPRHQIIPRTPVLSSPWRVDSQVHDASTPSSTYKWVIPNIGVLVNTHTAMRDYHCRQL